jgi:hypothetical protein
MTGLVLKLHIVTLIVIKSKFFYKIGPICFELMVPPTYSPILLFPCGHSFFK